LKIVIRCPPVIIKSMVYTYAGDFESPASVYVSGIIIRSLLIKEGLNMMRLRRLVLIIVRLIT